eukprot:g574.t1
MSDEEQREEPEDDEHSNNVGGVQEQATDQGVADVGRAMTALELDGKSRRRPRSEAKEAKRETTPPRVVEGEINYAEIDFMNGTAKVFLEMKEGRVRVVETSPPSPMKKDQVPERFDVAYTDGSFRRFRIWTNILSFKST